MYVIKKELNTNGMKKTLWMLVMMLVSMTAMAYERTYVVDSFDGLECEGTVAVKLTSGSSKTIRAEGKMSELDKYEVYVKNQTLYIRVSDEVKAKSGNFKTVTFYVSAPKLNHITLSDVSSVTTDDLVMTGTRITLSGVSCLSAKRLTAKNLNLEVSGKSSFVTGSLVAKNVRGNFSGASVLSVQKSTVDNINLEQSGAGSMNLSATATGDASFNFTGNSSFDVTVDTPSMVQLQCSGCGGGTLSARCEKLRVFTSGVTSVHVNSSATKKEIRSSGLSRVKFE